MDAQHLTIHNGRESQVVEHFTAIPPDIRGPVLSMTFVIEAVHLRDLPRLVVPSYQRDSVWVSHFEGEEEKECFHAIEPAVDEITYTTWQRVRGKLRRGFKDDTD